MKELLDLGCGDGKITALIASQIPHGKIVGLDVSESMVQFASSKFSHDERSNLSFVAGDAINLPFEQEFDVVVSFSALHWVVEQERALKEIHRVLVPGGKAFIISYGKAPMNLSTLSEKLICSEEWSAYFPSYVSQKVYLQIMNIDRS